LDDDPAELGAQAARTGSESVVGRVRERLVSHLASLRPRERQQAVTLAGPHRDDMTFLSGNVDLRTYGSRGQQRLAALSLRLAEVAFMESVTSERPVLLLDDVMSELDPQRRRFLQGVVREHEQVLVTATEPDVFDDAFRRAADLYRVEAGAILPAPPGEGT
jgi:DNA replication and repair protein RecF